MTLLSSTHTPTQTSIQIIEETIVSFSPKSTILPLTFLDIPWLLFPPNQPLFFFQLPTYSENHQKSTNINIDNFKSEFKSISANHLKSTNNNMVNFELEFNSTILPRLKTSLTLTLEQFYLFTATLAPSHTNPHDLFFTTYENSSIKIIVAKSNENFHQLCGYHMRDVDIFHNLVPYLPPINSSSYPNSLLSIQITCFPSSNAFSIGFSCYPVVCDQRTFSNFVHTWACLSKFGEFKHETTPSFDRSVIVDTKKLLPCLMKQWRRSKTAAAAALPVSPSVNSMSHGTHTCSAGELLPTTSTKPNHNVVRATFVMKPTDINHIKQWIEAQCKNLNKALPVILSPYVVTCALTWYCFIRAQQKGNCDPSSTGPMYFGFIAGGLTRIPYPVPSNYFGNCVGFGRAVASREELLKGDGILAAADAIGLAIMSLNDDLLGGADRWIPDWETVIGSGESMNVVGSPKVGLYEIDFGWGKPKKIEEISIDVMKGSVSLMESRDVKGGIEIGLSLPKYQMNAFSTLFVQGLQQFSSGSSL